jgi:hypothetical protein
LPAGIWRWTEGIAHLAGQSFMTRTDMPWCQFALALPAWRTAAKAERLADLSYNVVGICSISKMQCERSTAA